MNGVFELLQSAQSGNKQAELLLLERYEKLIYKLSWHHGQYIGFPHLILRGFIKLNRASNLLL
ncbi:helix-turn-helix domain-containing protein [Paenibacillus sp. S150]|uniref:helix-turn-helix domain-containing protein n=1 Tax=Paenibacillus sp. S150 TaxID=2749826 RepID=UPI001C55B357|nr:helix-turn-helix domain-containing protein [Paenibacillus sp. S150]MBW4085709.1 helix-turn-helix domain-containing protein [Paenibacillus sp. S150]